MKNSFAKTLFVGGLLIIGCSQNGFAQSGCQDPLATNFNPSATQTDSSCVYPITNWSHTNRIAGLPSILDESSSLLFTDKRLFTNTDGGNPNRIYEIDSLSGQVKKTTEIWNFNNVDWEDLAADSQHLYIGDFGNNDGDRTSLRVLKVKKTEVYHPDSLSIKADAIRFFYPNQTSFAASTTHNFDCEAFFYYQNKLHLFTKNRGNNKTTYYQMGSEPNFIPAAATLIDSLDVGGLITSASIRSDGKVVVLLGYEPQSLKVFAWLLFGYPENRFFSGNRRRIELPAVSTSGQMEGICFVDDYRLWISNEKLGLVPARVRQLNIRNLIQPYFTPIEPFVNLRNAIKTVERNGETGLEIRASEAGQILISDVNGRIVFRKEIETSESTSLFPKLPPGLYFARLLSQTGNSVGQTKFMFH
ncbi:MAG TPA: T9SS type A sorting domain-containing protein [Catalimonadaceae bacterium]|nr:T9SS type A sorting domain-containing protein [Catalimonadaceae bacterium]